MKSILMLVCGVLSIGGGALHTSGLRIIDAALAKANVTGELAHIVDLAWVFMGMAMIAFGGILFTCGLQMRKKNYGGRVLAIWVAACLALFSGGAMIRLGFDFRFLYFLIVGVVSAFACLPDKKTA
jgi:hypothetical protein